MIKGAFFDRDGVLNKDVHYLYRPEDVQWVPGAKEAVAELTRQGYAVIIVTNQSGVARGYYTEADVQALHAWMKREFAAAGGKITDIYYCPYLAGAAVPAYDKDSDWRKPAPGMVLQAAQDHHIDLSRSFLVGDKESDLACAAAAGVQGYLFSKGRLDDLVHSIIEEGNCHEGL